ncbi:MAG: class I SAM-dependent methyltransferase [Gammaproteobacteria bacterium]|nr:class I SAM-dependent methyltransferase [Gammaproteobacteria bacterium]
MKPFAESCAQNQHAILEVLLQEFASVQHVLEIGSGTGQHAVFFARALPHLVWQTSDVDKHHPGIHAWIADEGPDNVCAPLSLNVERDDWPNRTFDAVFSANTVHIMNWQEVINMFSGIGRILANGGRFCLYGPFNVDGQFTSASNARFEQWLKSQNPKSGIRDQGELDKLAEKAGLSRIATHVMPANNNILVWEK